MLFLSFGFNVFKEGGTPVCAMCGGYFKALPVDPKQKGRHTVHRKLTPCPVEHITGPYLGRVGEDHIGCLCGRQVVFRRLLPTRYSTLSAQEFYLDNLLPFLCNV